MIFVAMTAALALSASGGVILGHFSPRFDAKAATFDVASCSVVYERLDAAAARLVDREARTTGVVQAWRGKQRLEPFVAIVRSSAGADELDEARRSGSQALGLIGEAMAPGDSKTDPHIQNARFFYAFAALCDRQLDIWKAPALSALPSDVARLGYAPFRVGGKAPAEVFAKPQDAALAETVCDNVAGVARAITAGGDPNASGFQGVTPLMWALACESGPGLEALLLAGADPNKPYDKKGSTPVLLAAGYRNTDLLRLLLAHRGDPNAHDEQDTALMTALKMGRAGAGWGNWDLLLAAGADINLDIGDENFSNTAAISAVESGEWDKAIDLVERGYNHRLDELGRALEIFGSHAGPEDASKVVRLRRMLVERAVTFPVPDQKIWMKYRALDGATRKGTGDAAENLGRHYGKKDDGFDGESTDLWYYADVDAFVEEVDRADSERHGAVQIDEARLKSLWRLTDAEINAIRQSPKTWKRRDFE